MQASCSISRCTPPETFPTAAASSPARDAPSPTVRSAITRRTVSPWTPVRLVRSCTVSANYRGIIARGGSCYLIDNNCYLNELNGIEINDNNGRGNRGRNNCSWNKGFGILVQAGSDNLVIRNNAHQNGPTYGSEPNYSIDLPNELPLPGAAAGPIVSYGSNTTIHEISPWANSR